MSPRGKSKILLTGPPGCGKTTLIKKFVDNISLPVCGFFTQEIKEKGRRVGFEVESFGDNSRKAILAHIEVQSRYHVGRYNVDIDAFEKLIVPELENTIIGNKIIIIDEIGKMELFSERFKDILIDIFGSDRSLLASIMLKPQPFCDKLKNRLDSTILAISPSNRNAVLDELVNIFQNESPYKV